MSAFTLIYTRAAQVFPSTKVNIPFPNMVMLGTNTSVGTDQLIDSAVDFIASGIKVGDTIFNPTTQVYAIIIGVSTTILTLSDDIFLISSDNYIIYQSPNYGCYIYIPTGSIGTLDVETIGGDQVSFIDPPGGILPVQVRKVLEYTTIGDLLALW
jgi:hypothetical protein